MARTNSFSCLIQIGNCHFLSPALPSTVLITLEIGVTRQTFYKRLKNQRADRSKKEKEKKSETFVEKSLGDKKERKTIEKKRKHTSSLN